MVSLSLVLLLLLFNYSSVYALCGVGGSPWTGQCTYTCQDITEVHPGHEMAKHVMENSGACLPWAGTFIMVFSNCSFPDGHLDVDWFSQEVSLQFSVLQFISCDLNHIEDSALSSYPAFQNYIDAFLVIGSPELTVLSGGILSGATSPNFYNFQWIRGGVIEAVETQLFQPIMPTLTNLGLDEVGFQSPQVLANITGVCQTKPLNGNLRFVSVSKLLPGYGIPVLSSKLFSAIEPHEVVNVFLDRAGIQFFEDNTALDAFFPPIEFKYASQISLAGNQLKNIPSGSFERLIYANVSVTVDLSGNPWHCDCHLQYVQDVLASASNKLTLKDGALCASPPSQAGFPILEADMQSTECEQTPQTPPAVIIQC